MRRAAIAFLCLLIGGSAAAQAPNPILEKELELQRDFMVDNQLKARGIQDERVLQVMRKIKRHEFVPNELATAAYDDSPLPIGQGQTISQPYIVAHMTEALELKNTDRVLEIGTGSGYQAAVLAEIVQDVYSIEIVPELAGEAQKRLEAMGYKNIHVRHGDGYQGWPEQAPFDAIILTAAPGSIPEKLLEQLKPGGRMIAPVGHENQVLRLLIKTPEGLVQKDLYPVRFVPMVKTEPQRRFS
jgi:protein-L-isoaspartate(D-aspartate) O-methyltransferase